MINNNFYSILVEDTGRTFNINMYSYECFAKDEREALKKMYKNRPEFKGREVTRVKLIK